MIHLFLFEMNPLMSKSEKRFWERVDIRGPNDCWFWTKALCHGYGSVRFERRICRAHRVAYELTFGKIPGGLYCCHRCDNPICCNPDHLFVGTQKDNIQDCSRKGRKHAFKGIDSPSHKLTEEDVLMIRSKYALGKNTQRDLANEFNINQRTVGRIINGERWGHIKEGLNND